MLASLEVISCAFAVGEREGSAVETKDSCKTRFEQTTRAREHVRAHSLIVLSASFCYRRVSFIWM